MSEVTRRLIARVGVDIAKQVIHVHAVDGESLGSSLATCLPAFAERLRAR